MSQENQDAKKRVEMSRKRSAEKRARRKKRLMIRTTMLFVLLLILVAIIFVAGRVIRKGDSSAMEDKVISDITPAKDQSSETVTSAAEVQEEAKTDSAVNVDLNKIESASTKEEALSYAKAYATQYDYDKAIAVIENFKDSDAELKAAAEQYAAEKEACVAVDVTNVPHVFFHSLINDDRGLREEIVGRDRAWRNDAAMTTANEFDHILEDMYEAGYVMVSLDDLVVKTKNDDGSVAIAPNHNLMLPKGKKAFVLSEDDLSYYHTYGIGTQGYATKMLLDENGEVKCEYTDENGETKIGDYDVVPRMDSFVKKHPDFSYHGHKGTVALTGYNGVFGYRTNDYYKDINNENLSPDQVQWLKDHPDFDWDQDVAAAKEIADAMKATGWTFASHTYGHWNASSKTAEQLKSDNERWMTVNHNIVGDIDKIIFAFGGDIAGVEDYTMENEKYAYFKKQGYNIFCNVDGNIGWTQFGDGYLRTGRVALDGFTMYQAMTESAASHTTYAHDYEVLGVKNISEFFNKYRITPIEGE